MVTILCIKTQPNYPAPIELPMSTHSLASQISAQISAVFSVATHPHPPPLDLLVSELAAASAHKAHIFLFGVGREALMLKAFCMRLAHLGLSAHFVSDVTTPPITAKDLLLASAGPGGFATVDAICSIARSSGAKVLLLTAQPDGGSCVKYAAGICYVPAQTMADDADDADDAAEEVVASSRPLLPMGSVYEGALFVLFEMAVYKLGEILGESPETVRSRHTNLE